MRRISPKDKMITKFCITTLTLLLVCSCSDPDKDRQIDQFKRTIYSDLSQSKNILDTLNCQAIQNKQVAIYRDLVKDLNKIIDSFVDTSATHETISRKNLSEKVSKLNMVYHLRVDSSIRSVSYKLFPENDTFFIYASFFKVDSSDSDPVRNYYLTCISVLDEHLNIIKKGRPVFSHDPCTD